MAVQNPFFGKREPEPFQRHTTPANGLNTLAPGSAQRWAAPAGGLTGQKPQASSVGDQLGQQAHGGPQHQAQGRGDHRLRHAGGGGHGRGHHGFARDPDRASRGAFKGSAEIDIAEIHGEFNGTLTVRQKLVIYSTGKVSGKIRYGKLVIEEGGQLSGEIEAGMGAGARASAAPAVCARRARRHGGLRRSENRPGLQPWAGACGLGSGRGRPLASMAT